MKAKLFLSGAILALCAGCGNESTSEAPATSAEVSEATTESKPDHLLSAEQELIEQAKQVEAMLKEDADEKKKAVAEELAN